MTYLLVSHGYNCIECWRIDTGYIVALFDSRGSVYVYIVTQKILAFLEGTWVLKKTACCSKMLKLVKNVKMLAVITTYIPLSKNQNHC